MITMILIILINVIIIITTIIIIVSIILIIIIIIMIYNVGIKMITHEDIDVTSNVAVGPSGLNGPKAQ